ncbi:MAG: hypothetical protein ACTHJR_13130 [Sphingomonas sp.]|uniref:hypothetical protein n=1 Tax=Sphingomonas sp. TaxID=28214 RepID=UPI003F7DA7B4
MSAAGGAGLVGMLGLAASPTFAGMAILTSIGSGPVVTFCSGGGAFPLGGMVPMYLLMSVFHAAPWLRLVAGRAAPGERVIPRN